MNTNYKEMKMCVCKEMTVSDDNMCEYVSTLVCAYVPERVRETETENGKERIRVLSRRPFILLKRKKEK